MKIQEVALDIEAVMNIQEVVSIIQQVVSNVFWTRSASRYRHCDEYSKSGSQRQVLYLINSS